MASGHGRSPFCELMYIYNKSRFLLGEEQAQRARRVGPVDDLDLVRADLVVELADRVLDGLLASVLPLATRSEALARAGAARFTTSYPSCSPSPFCYSIQNPGPGRPGARRLRMLSRRPSSV